ncbi:hypothetical protein [Actinoplanes utahensis]|uniref:hypothetical protein n=1 Tax=Actinoplanes utahensis TaxID=1869 RepID=UPI00126A13D0|nr:hypothetical protein [Actinoplanes utahensis]GIF35603.1 hypothetical protein Aut01nite_85890 [Actinoplanes utahensis]
MSDEPTIAPRSDSPIDQAAWRGEMIELANQQFDNDGDEPAVSDPTAPSSTATMKSGRDLRSARRPPR